LRCMSEMGIEMKVSEPSGWHGASAVSAVSKRPYATP
jgi:hypothetical protein